MGAAQEGKIEFSATCKEHDASLGGWTPLIIKRGIKSGVQIWEIDISQMNCPMCSMVDVPDRDRVYVLAPESFVAEETRGMWQRKVQRDVVEADNDLHERIREVIAKKPLPNK